MTVLAVYSIKGGVGKTATAVNLAYLAALEGKQTLLCDLDPQSSATFYFRVKPKVKAGIKPFLEGKGRLAKAVKGTDYVHLDLLPADFSFRNLDLAFRKAKRSKKRLQAIMKLFRDEYDLIFLDCPPNLTLLSENVFHAADYLIHPLIPTTLSHRTLVMMLRFLQKEGLDRNRVLPFFSMVERRKNMHRQTMDIVSSRIENVLESRIPYLSDIEHMGTFREPVHRYKPHSPATLAYRNLWAEIVKRVEAGP